MATTPAWCGDGESALTAKLYGTLKTDFQYVDGNTTNNEYAIFSAPGAPNSTFRASVRGSRLGVNLAEKDLGLTGKVETDFLGVTDGGTLTDLRLRHAYVTKAFGDLTVLVGQTWSLTPTELPDTVNDYFLGYSGALWNRSAQLRGTYKLNKMFTLAAAVARPTKTLTDNNGTTSAMPGAQAQATVTLGPAKINVSGIWERQKQSAMAAGTTSSKADTNLVALGLTYGFGPLTLSGQAWIGRNVDDFNGGAANSSVANIYNNGGIRAKGGYAALKYKPVDQFYTNFICGIDKPNDSDVKATASATSTSNKLQNGTCLANVNYVYSKVITTLEFAHNETEYYDTATAGSYTSKSNRMQMTMKYLF